MSKHTIEETVERQSKNEDFAYDYHQEMPRFGRKGPSMLRQRFTKGITYFVVVAACILFYFALLRLHTISAALLSILDVLRPVVYGCVIAYVLNPIVRFCDAALFPVLEKRISSYSKARKYARVISIFVALVIMITVLVTLVNMLLPQLFISIRNMIYVLPGQINHMMANLDQFFSSETATNSVVKGLLTQATDALQNWMRTDLLSKVNEYIGNVTEGVIVVVGELFNAIIGVIISVYILSSKEILFRQGKRITYAILSADHANLLLHIVRKTDEMFGGFIIGKIIDSVIIGILCFIGLSILNMPYTMLVSVIIGVTNVIPFFGPYIGAVPTTILILLTNPVQAIYFLIFILVLQQIDGNIIGPKILGSSTGLSPFWVVVAILVGGGMFGIVGMIAGVPTLGVLFYLAEMVIRGKLENKNLPTSAECYVPKSFVSDDGEFHGTVEYYDEIEEEIKEE